MITRNFNNTKSNRYAQVVEKGNIDPVYCFFQEIEKNFEINEKSEKN
jgi:hypothetical protein